MKVNKFHRKYLIKLIFQICKLYLQKRNNQEDLTNLSYNKISEIYDLTYTNHVQEFSTDMVSRLNISRNSIGLDLSCGTGYVTGLLAKKIEGEITGVDISEGMLKVARKKYGDRCNFICSEVYEYLRNQPSKSFDVITWAWGLGYTKTLKTIKEIARILKPGGKVGIIDHSLFTIYEIVFSGILTVAEYPDAITNVMNVRWLPFNSSLSNRMRFWGLKIESSWKGEKTYYVKNRNDLINRLIDTGTASGYENCFKKEYSQIIKNRFVEIFEKLYGTDKGLPITYRYIASIGLKPN